MEEYDDLVPTPEADGRLVLTYRGWTLVDDVVWTMGRELLVLDVSFNAVTEFPPELGDLIHLRELNCSNNKLASLPKQIGKLRTMHVLKANGNKLTRLPDELGLCSGLVYVNLGENRLVTVPPTLANLSNIEELHLCNNRMNYFPPTAGLQVKLTKIDLTNNPALAHMFPVALQGNHEFIRWMCAKSNTHDERSSLVRAVNKDYEALLDAAFESTGGMIGEVEMLHRDRRVLADLMPRGLDRECMDWYTYFCIKGGLRKCSVM